MMKQTTLTARISFFTRALHFRIAFLQGSMNFHQRIRSVRVSQVRAARQHIVLLTQAALLNLGLSPAAKVLDLAMRVRVVGGRAKIDEPLTERHSQRLPQQGNNEPAEQRPQRRWVPARREVLFGG
jgi:hypothetical protein